MSRKRGRRLWSLTAAVLCTLALAACGSSHSGSAKGSAKGGAIVIGDEDDLSGPLALYGQFTLNYLRAAVAYANKHGGVGGRQIKVVTADAAASGQNASSAFQQLMSSSNPAIIFGLTLSNDCEAIAPLAAAHQVPIVCSSVPPSAMHPVTKYLFGSGVVEAQEASSSIDFLTNTLHLQHGATIATLALGDLGAEAYATAVQKRARTAGLKVVDSEVIPLSSTNPDSQFAKVVSAHPQAVVAEVSTPMVQPLVQQLRAAGNNAPVIVADGQVGLSTYTAVKDPHLYGINVAKIITDPNTTDSGPALAVSAMKLTGQTTVTQLNQALGLEAFPPAYGAIQALQNCKGCTGSTLVTSLESVRTQLPGLVSGTFGWSSSLHLPYKAAYFYAYDAATQVPQPVGPAVPLGPISG